MITGFNNSFFSKLINYNDPRVESYADNLYEKIRQLGILPVFVQRDKFVRGRQDIVDSSETPEIFTKDDRFTFGYAYMGTRLDVEAGSLDIEKVWQVEFELFIPTGESDTAYFFNDFIKVFPNLTLSVGDILFSSLDLQYDYINKIKIIRNHTSIYLEINGVSQPLRTLSDNDNTQFNIVYRVGDGELPTIQYFLDLELNIESSGVLSGEGYYDEGSIVTINAVASPGYVFVNWTEDDVEIGTDSSIDVTVDSDKLIVANFMPEGTLLYRASISVGPGPDYNMDTDTNVPYSENVSIQVESPVLPGYNYFFVSAPTSRSLIIRNSLFLDVTSSYSAIGTDNRVGYYGNTVYRKGSVFDTEEHVIFHLTFS